MILSDVVHVAGKDKLPKMYGMLRTLCDISALCGTPLSGWLFEVTGGSRFLGRPYKSNSKRRR